MSTLQASFPKIGVLQLKTDFPRPEGDVSNQASWRYPIVVAVVKEAVSANVVGGTWGPELVEAFAREGRRLIAEENVVALVTSCGFLATMHPLLAEKLPSIGTSSLLQVPLLQALYGKDKVGVITFKKSALTARHFTSVGVEDPSLVDFEGVPEGGIFARVLNSEIPYDFEGMKQEVLDAALLLCKNKPDTKAICVECTNIPPFSKAIQDATGLPVYDVITLGEWLYEGKVRKDYRI